MNYNKMKKNCVKHLEDESIIVCRNEEISKNQNFILESDKEKKEINANTNDLNLDINNVNVKLPQINNEYSLQPENNKSQYSNIHDYGYSPFKNSNINNLQFNYSLKARNLFNSINFESPYRRNQNQSQYSQLSPLNSLKIPNSSAFNKSFGEFEGMYYPYPTESNMSEFLNRINYNSRPPSFSPICNRHMTEKARVKNILSYLNFDNQKEMKNKENIQILLYKNEKLIKKFFDIKEEIFCSSEENSRHKIKTENSNGSDIFGGGSNRSNASNHLYDENTIISGSSSKYIINYGNLLNNTSRTIRNLNLDFNINFKDKDTQHNTAYYNTINKSSNFGIPHINLGKPSINRNFLIEEELNKVMKNDITTGIIQQESKVSKVECKCKKSKCLKLYCECFANGEICKNCNCVNCHNLETNNKQRKETINLIKEKNPNAFNIQVSYGCNCTKSNCKKKYCECFQKSLGCSEMCRCRNCKNNKEVSHSKGVVVENSFIFNETDTRNNFLNDDNREFSLNLSSRKLRSEEFKIENTSIFLNSSKQLPRDFLKVPRNFNFNLSRDVIKNKKKMKKFTKKKRTRQSKIINQGNKDIVVLFNKTIDNNLINNNQLTLATPKKQNKINKNSINLTSKNKRNVNTSDKSFRKSERIYKDTTLSHMMTTAPTTNKKRNDIILNTQDITKNIVRKLNMNVNNESLFENKNFG